MRIKLNGVEARLLGALIEKSLTTPEQYPLTYNSLLLACNQKTSRDPVMNLTEETAGPSLHALIERGLIERLHEPGSRVPKFCHGLETFLPGADAKTIGVACVLLLRGAQTPGELKTRTDRLCEFASTAEVESLLSDLAARPEPLVAKLPRQPGQKESRYRHLFSDEAGAAAPASPTMPANPAAAAPAAPAAPDRVAGLEKRVAELEARCRALEERLTPAKEPAA
ncbi:MAG: YceH family protein [Elusimicrobiota bacterium]